MTATITTSDRFSSVTHNFSERRIHGFSQVRFTTDEDPSVSGDIGLVEGGLLPAAGSEEGDNLRVLQDIWASSDGFRDADGNSITVRLNDCPFTTDIGELESHGYLNPFDADSWDRWVEFLKMRGRFQEGATITNEGDIHLHFNIEGEPFAPPSGDTEFSLADYWRTYELHGTSNNFFYFTIAVEAEDGYTSDTIGEHYPVRALLAWLNDNRHSTSTTEVDLTPSTQNEIRVALLLASSFDVDQGAGSGHLYFRVNEVRVDDDGTNVTRLEILFQEQADTPVGYDLEAMQRVLEGVDVTVTTGSDATEVPTFGPFWGLQWVIDSVRRFIPRQDRLVHRGRDSQGSYEIPLEGGVFREVEYDALDDDPDHSGQKIMAAGSHVRVVHFREDSDGIIRIPDLPDFVYSPGSGEDCEIHNVSETAGVTCEVRDFDNDNIGTLLPKERLALRAMLFKNNRGELTNGAAPFLRKYIRQDASIAVGANSANYMTLSGRRVRAVPFSTDDPHLIHEEAFEEGTTQPTNGSSYTSQSSYFIKYSQKVKKAGSVTVSGHIVIDIDGAATGSLIGPILDLSHFRGTTETILATKTFGDWAAGDDAVFDIMASVDVEEDDVFLVSLSYEDSSTMGLSNVKTTTYRLTKKLEQAINLEFIPS